MKTSRFTLANLVLGLLLASPFLVQVTTSAGVYDPWYDLDENGAIDIFDVVRVAGAYGTTGDATKNVTVTNWPVTRALFPENLILKGAIFKNGVDWRRDLVDSTTHHPPSTWPRVASESESVVGTLNATYRLFYDKTFTHQKVSLEPYLILGSPTVTMTINVTTFSSTGCKFDCLAYLGKVDFEGTYVELAFLGNTTVQLTGTFNPPELFTWTMSYPPNPPLETVIDAGWRLAVRLQIFGQRYSTESDTTFWLNIMARRNADDFVVDIPFIQNPP